MSAGRPVHCAVIGAAGVLGKLIAADFALQGIIVHAYDRDRSTLLRARQDTRSYLNELITSGLLQDGDLELYEDNVVLHESIGEDLRSCSCIIEAGPESKAIKAQIYQDISSYQMPSALVGTTSMSMSISELSSLFMVPSNHFMGVRFLFPVVLISDVEITPALETSNLAIDQWQAFLRSIHKTPFYKKPGTQAFLRLGPADIRQAQQASAEQRRQRTTASQSFQSDGHASGRSKCCVCLDAAPSCTCVPCGHLCLCTACGASYNTSAKCPVCRGPVSSVMRVFQS